MDVGNVPFPSVEDILEMTIQESSTRTPTPEALLKRSLSTTSPVESNNRASSTSNLTTSDKVSALPAEFQTSSGFRRPSQSSNNIKRGWRRSLDAITSYPSIASAVDSDHGIWGAFRNAGKRQSTPEGSTGKETPKQRVSFDSGRDSPNLRNINQVVGRKPRSNDPQSSIPTSPVLRSSPLSGREEEFAESNRHLSSPSFSRSRSRAASPLRMFQQWSSGLHRGHHEPFVPVDPFRFKSRLPLCGFKSYDHEDVEVSVSTSTGAYDCDDLIPVNSFRSFFTDFRMFITDILPRELYLNLLLRLPAMYFSRVARIFEDADISKPDIERMINTSGGARHSPVITQTNINGSIHGAANVATSPAGPMIHLPLPFPDEWTPAVVSPALIRFKHSWEAFIDSLVREWKTLNVVSALLASAILTIFQIPEAAEDPLTRTFSLLSLVCALLSLSYGCIYIVRFGAMRSMFHASRWAEEAQKTKTFIWWNVWVMLATPAVWMAWAMLLFISAILSFVWRTGSVEDPEDRPPLSANAALGPRIAITLVFILGMVYLVMIVKTLRKYGHHQNAVRALVQAGSVPKVVGNQDHVVVHKDKKLRSKSAERGFEAGLERRGRERERDSSKRVRQREDDVERRGRSLHDRDGHDSNAGGLRGVLGLMGFHSRQASPAASDDGDIEDLDKNTETVDIYELRSL